MPSLTPEFVRDCRSCGRELIPGSLACEHCHQLVYSQELEKLSSEAKSLEAQGKLLEAREHWLRGLPLLPKNSKQAEWNEERAKALNLAAANQQPGSEGKWEKRLGPLGVLGVILLKGKTLLFALFKLKFLLELCVVHRHLLGVVWCSLRGRIRRDESSSMKWDITLM